jgi:Flp pilus assembly protein TadG
MPAPRLFTPRPRACRHKGATAVEFALLATVFFALVFGIMEVARLIYVYNTLQEVTRRAAANAVQVFPRDTAGLAQVRHDAVFRSSPGNLVLAPPVTSEHVRIDYLALTRDSSSAMSLTPIPESLLPSCPGQNRQVCTNNPNAPNCIRFVRVRICDPATASECIAARSGSLVSLVAFGIPLHKATTIARVETLGYQPGTPPCAAP